MGNAAETKDVGIGVETTVSKLEEPNAVSKRSRNMEIWLERTLLPRTLTQGTFGMKQAGSEFLPQHSLESNTAFANRLQGATLLNAYMKTIAFLAGQVFQTDVIFDETVPDDVEDWTASIDARGNAFNVFAKRFFVSGLAKGVNHILIDVPKRPEGAKTKADDKKFGIRPYFKVISPEDILGTVEDETGKVVLVRILESVAVRNGRFGTKIMKRIRILEAGKWEVVEEALDGSVTSIDKGEFNTDVIPLVSFIPSEEWTPVTGAPPMDDLAELNKAHWVSQAHQTNILNVARVPILFGRKIELEKMPVGVATMVVSDDEGSDMKYVEHSGQAIAAGQVDLTELEAKMALYGLQQLVPRAGNMTATEKTLTSQEANSSLAEWGLELQATLQSAFEIACDMMDLEFPKGGLEVNTDFFIGIADPNLLSMLLKAHDQGILSAQACFSEFRRRAVLDEHLDWEDMAADLEQENREKLAAMQGFDDMSGDKGKGEGSE